MSETLGSLELQPEDAGAAALARRYAATIDRAHVLAAEVAALDYDPDVAKRVAVLEQKLAAHQVLVDIGPKLLTVLESLGATPKARAQVAKPATPAGTSKLTALRKAAGS